MLHSEWLVDSSGTDFISERLKTVDRTEYSLSDVQNIAAGMRMQIGTVQMVWTLIAIAQAVQLLN